jgi:K+-sensing histidine kinase KdpD
MTPRRRLVSRYSLAVLAVLLAALLHAALDPVWGGRIPFVAFYPAVVFVAWFAGMGPGLLATVLSALLITRAWLVAPSVSLEGHVVALAFFVGAGVTVSLLVAARDRARESWTCSCATRRSAWPSTTPISGTSASTTPWPR